MSVLRATLRGLQRLVPDLPGGGRVLCYHLVGAGTGSPVDLPEAEFRRQLDLLGELGHIATLRELREPALAAVSPDESLFTLTFDDAFGNFAEVVFPILEARRLPATLFVPTGFLNGQIPGPLARAEGLPPVSWDWLSDALSTGLLTIGSHTRTHPDTRRLDGVRLSAELRDSRVELEDRLGVEVDAFCYPRALWSVPVERQVRRHYRCAVVGGGYSIKSGAANPFRIYRTSVRSAPPLPVRQWAAARFWVEEAVADFARQLR